MMGLLKTGTILEVWAFAMDGGRWVKATVYGCKEDGIVASMRNGSMVELPWDQHDRLWRRAQWRNPTND
jgi:hypothetical protein